MNYYLIGFYSEYGISKRTFRQIFPESPKKGGLSVQKHTTNPSLKLYEQKLIIFLFLMLLGSNIKSQTISETNFSGNVGSGARALGVGGAFIAIADDATSASWNPGGLGQLEKVELSMVLQRHYYRKIVSAMKDDFNFIGAQDMRASSYSFDFLSFTYPFRIKKLKIVPLVAYQRSISYNLDNHLEDVRFMNIESSTPLSTYIKREGKITLIDHFTGGFDNISFSVGTQFFKIFNFGFTTNLWLNGFEGDIIEDFNGIISISKDLNFKNPSIFSNTNIVSNKYVNFKLKGLNASINIGVLINILQNLNIGAVYKSPFEGNIEHTIKQDFKTSGIPDTILTKYLKLKDFDSYNTLLLKWPQTFGIGASYRPIDPLTFSVDFTTTHWSKGSLTGNNVDALYFPTLKPIAMKEGQFNSQQYRFGLEYIIIGEKNFIPIRFGIFYDSQYYPDATGHTIGFNGFAGGLGIKRGSISADFTIVSVFGKYNRNKNDYALAQFNESKIYFSIAYSFK